MGRNHCLFHEEMFLNDVYSVKLLPHGRKKQNSRHQQLRALMFFMICVYFPYSVQAYNQDGMLTCSRPDKVSRMSRMLRNDKLLKKIPCELNQVTNYCALPGPTYPWHSVRQFIQDNQGLMRRMYGEVRELSLLRMEAFEDDELDDFFPVPEDLKPLKTNSIDQLGTFVQGKEHVVRMDPSLLEEASTPLIEKKIGMINNGRIEVIEDLLRASDTVEDSTTDVETSTTMKMETMPLTTGPDKLEVEPSIVEDDVSTTTPISMVPKKTDLVGDIKDDTIDSENKSEDQDKEGLPPTYEEDEDLPEERTTIPIASTSEPSPTSKESFQAQLGDDEGDDESQKDVKSSLEVTIVEKTSLTPEDLERTILEDEELITVNACPTKEEVVAPYWANSTRGEILALLNLHPFEQYVHWQKCILPKDRGQCMTHCRCEQEYRLHRLLAFDPENECRGIFSDWFRFPSCCVCKCYEKRKKKMVEHGFEGLRRTGRKENAKFLKSPTVPHFFYNVIQV